MEGWIGVYKTKRVVDAEIVRAMLEDQGIEAVVMNSTDRSLLFGEAIVYCPAENEMEARKLILEGYSNNLNDE